MSDSTDSNGGGIEGQSPGEEKPLRWAPGEGAAPQRLSAPPPSEFPPPSEEPPPPLSQPPLPSWERLEEEGFGRALVLTIKEVLFQPGETFARMPRTATLGRPLLFAVLVGTFGAVVATCYDTLSRAVSPSAQQFYARLFQQFGIQEVPGPRELLFWSMCGIALTPFLIIIGAFVGSGVFHLLLMLFGGANHGYETTFRTVCYTYGAAAVLAIIPMCGQGLIMPIWFIVCCIIGLSRTQETSAGKAVAAVLAPLVLCCCCIGALIGGLIGMLAPGILSNLR